MVSSEIGVLSFSFSARSGIRSRENNTVRDMSRIRKADVRPSLFSSPHGAPVNGVEKFGVLAPIFLYFDEEFQKHFVPHHLFDLVARQCSDFLEACAGGTDDDGLLAIPFDINGGGDPSQPGCFLPAIDEDSGGV